MGLLLIFYYVFTLIKKKKNSLNYIKKRRKLEAVFPIGTTYVVVVGSSFKVMLVANTMHNATRIKVLIIKTKFQIEIKNAYYW